MPSLAFRCPLCGQAFQVAAEHQGQPVQCPHCGGAVAIPRESRMSAATDERAPPVPSQPPAEDGISGQIAAPSQPRASVGEEWRRDSQQLVHIQERRSQTIHYAGRSYNVRSLTPEERAAFRRRINLWFFGLTAALLTAAVLALLLWQS